MLKKIITASEVKENLKRKDEIINLEIDKINYRITEDIVKLGSNFTIISIPSFYENKIIPLIKKAGFKVTIINKFTDSTGDCISIKVDLQ